MLYLAIPNQNFPEKIESAYISSEPSDVELDERRGYYLDETREEVIQHYKGVFSLNAFGVVIKPIRLNYPPEEAQIVIRDQTRSTFLEELVFPFRESIFINGFEPTDDKDAIVINSIRYRQKVIVRHVQSEPIVRVTIGLTSSLFLYVVLQNFFITVTKALWKHS